MVESGVADRKLPIKLANEPLIDAVFEIRFSANPSVANVLPGMLFTLLDGDKSIEQMPIAHLPKEIRENDPNLQHAPLLKISWDKYWIFIGDSVFTVACKLPYPGWSEFQPAIHRITKLALETGLIDLITRYSIKYVNLINNVGKSVVDIFNLKIEVGSRHLGSQDFQMRAETVDNGITTYIQIVSQADMSIVGVGDRSGAILDVDSLVQIEGEVPATFISKLPERLNKIRPHNKKIFFDCLSETTLKDLGPIYE